MNRFRTLRNKTNRLSTRLKEQYYKKCIEGSSGKQWWNNVKKLTQFSKQSHGALLTLANSICQGSLASLATNVNVFFQSVGNAVPPLEPNNPFLSDHFETNDFVISVPDVEQKLCHININKSSGPDGIPGWVLRDFCGILAPPIAAIFNSSIRECTVPALWKAANVICLPKKNPPTAIEKDLRPISLTPILSKVLEHFIVVWLLKTIRPKLDPCQFGGISGSSSTHALVKLVHEWSAATDKSSLNNYVRIVNLDFSKAFDLIDHNILLNKLVDFEVPEILIRWIANFLYDRKQRVKIGNVFSDWLPISAGVPQGTKLGPILFLCMINSFDTSCDHCKYIDDTSLYKTSSNPNDSVFQEAVDQASHWASTHNMRLNPTKTTDTIIDFRKEPRVFPTLSINNSPIATSDCFKLLGVTFSRKLQWDNHVKSIVGKANSRLFFLKQLKRGGGQRSDLVTFLKSVIVPVLEYACAAWHPLLTEQLHESLENVQKRACRIICPFVPYEEALDILGLVTLRERRDKLSLDFFKSIETPEHALHSLLPPRHSGARATRRVYKYRRNMCMTDRYKNCLINWSIDRLYM